MEVLHPHCAGLDVHKETVVACVRHMVDGTIKRGFRTFDTTTTSLLALADWLASEGCTVVAMEATGVYRKPVWHVLSDGDFELVLANAKQVKNVSFQRTSTRQQLDCAKTLLLRSQVNRRTPISDGLSACS